MAAEIEGIQREIADLRHRISGEDCSPSADANSRILNHLDATLDLMGRVLSISNNQDSRIVTLERDKENERERRAGADW